MRLSFFLPFALIFGVSASQAQSVLDNLPPVIVESGTVADAPLAPSDDIPAPPPAVPADPYTVTDVSVDVTSDTTARMRDKALMQAQRTAYTQLCQRLGMADRSASLDDDALASLVRSFEIQSEHLSAVRYIGVFTIHFNQAAVQKGMTAQASTLTTPFLPFAPDQQTVATPQGPLFHTVFAVEADTLGAWMQIKRRLDSVQSIKKIDMRDFGRGLIHIDVTFEGGEETLKQGLGHQGLMIRATPQGEMQLVESTMFLR